MEEKSKSNRKGKIVNIVLGENQKRRIPQVFDTVFKIEQTAVTDGEDLANDETFRLHTLRTIDVEGVTRIPGKLAVNINGDFDINLDDDGEQSEKDLLDKVFADKEEAIAAWNLLTKLQVERAEALQAKINETVTMLRTSLEERQY